MANCVLSVLNKENDDDDDDDAPSGATIYRWIAEFQRGSKSTEDEHRSGRPVDVCTDENVRHVNDVITTDRRLTVRYIAACLKISYGTTHYLSLIHI